MPTAIKINVGCSRASVEICICTRVLCLRDFGIMKIIDIRERVYAKDDDDDETYEYIKRDETNGAYVVISVNGKRQAFKIS